MADSSVAITPGSGASVDTRTVTGGDHRQVMVPAGATDSEIAQFLNADPVGTEYGMVTRSFLYAMDGGLDFPATSVGTNVGSPHPLRIDDEGSLHVRGPILTDEGSFRDDFPGSSITGIGGAGTNLTGTVTTNGTTAVVGVSTLFMSEVNLKQYFKVTAHAESAWVQVTAIIDNTHLTLASNYAGANISGAAAHLSNWQTATVAQTGLALTVSTSKATIATGSVSGALLRTFRTVDYSPLRAAFYVDISQRVANQELTIGVFSDISNYATSAGAYIIFTGTTNTTCSLVTRANSVDSETVSVTLPMGTTVTQHRYALELETELVSLVIDDVMVAQTRLHIPNPYLVVQVGFAVNNTGAASNTTLNVDMVHVNNSDRIEVKRGFMGDAFSVSNRADPYAGGTSTYSFISTAAVQAASIKATPGQVYGLDFFSTASTPMYIRLYDVTGAPLTTDTPVWRGLVPGNSSNGAGFVINFDPPRQHPTGIGIRVSAAAADTDATALAANAVLGNARWK